MPMAELSTFDLELSTVIPLNCYPRFATSLTPPALCATPGGGLG